jgi:hypothetical protein
VAGSLDELIGDRNHVQLAGEAEPCEQLGVLAIVLTRSPAGLAVFDGATTSTSIPRARAAR